MKGSVVGDVHLCKLMTFFTPSFKHLIGAC
jgi:hypothetical protein